MIRTNNKFKYAKGQTIVEMALAMGLFLLFFISILNFQTTFDAISVYGMRLNFETLQYLSDASSPDDLMTALKPDNGFRHFSKSIEVVEEDSQDVLFSGELRSTYVAYEELENADRYTNTLTTNNLSEEIREDFRQYESHHVE